MSTRSDKESYVNRQVFAGLNIGFAEEIFRELKCLATNAYPLLSLSKSSQQFIRFSTEQLSRDGLRVSNG